MVVLDKAATPTLTDALHPDTQRWTVFPHSLMPGVLLRSTPTCSHLDMSPLALFPHSSSGWTNVLYVPESLNNCGFTSICNVNKNSKLDPENMLGFGWLMTENGTFSSHFTKRQWCTKENMFQPLQKHWKKINYMAYLIFSACDARWRTNKAWNI